MPSGHLEKLKKKGEISVPIVKIFTSLFSVDEVPVVFLPVKDDEGDFLAYQLSQDVLGQGGFACSGAPKDPHMAGEFREVKTE